MQMQNPPWLLFVFEFPPHEVDSLNKLHPPLAALQK